MAVSPCAKQLKALRLEAGLSMAEVARRLGYQHASRYQHYEDRYKKTYLPVDLVGRLAPLFLERGIARERLMALAGLGGTAPTEALRSPALTLDLSRFGKDLPVLGSAMGGSDGHFFNDGAAKDFVQRPPSLIGVTNAFAVYVYGDSMEPRYLRGEVVHINPNRPLTAGCFVVVELADGRGMIKQFVRQDDKRIVLRQFKPERDLTLDRREVARICRIVGSAEG